MYCVIDIMNIETIFVVLVLVLFVLVGNTTNATSTDCPIIDGEYLDYDLDRGWCHDYTGLLQHLLP
jgi:hypothetical protein